MGTSRQRIFFYEKDWPTQAENCIRFIAISDTHNLHDKLVLPAGDVLLHGGDFTDRGTMEEIEEFAAWLSSLPFAKKVVVPGNHDILLDEDAYATTGPLWHSHPQNPQAAIELLRSVCELGMHEFIDINVKNTDIRLFVSPYQPRQPKSRNPMAFGKTRGKQLKEKWEILSQTKNVDIVLTHSPPYGILDVGINNKHVGCEELLKALRRCRPFVHVFGHIHNSCGIHFLNNRITCVNASIKLTTAELNSPIVIDYLI